MKAIAIGIVLAILIGGAAWLVVERFDQSTAQRYKAGGDAVRIY